MTVRVPLEKTRGSWAPRGIALVVLLGAVSGASLLFAQTLPDFPELPLPELVSRPPGSVEAGNGPSRFPRLSPLASKVVFESRATDLHTLDSDAASDIYLFDRVEKNLVLVTFAGPPGVDQKKGDSFAPSVSKAGERVAFWSESTVFSPFDTHPGPDVYVADLTDPAAPPQIFLVSGRGSPAVGGMIPGNGPSDQPEISADGNVVVFRSKASNLTPPFFGKPFEFPQIYFAELPDVNAAGPVELHRIDPPHDPGQEGANGLCENPDVSPNGEHIVFMTRATNFLTVDTEDNPDIVLFRVTEGWFELLSQNPQTGQKLEAARAPRIGGINGERVVFEGTDTTAFDAPVPQIFLHDRNTQSLRIISLDRAGRPAAGACSVGDISLFGDCVVFSSDAQLVPSDTNDLPDVYIRFIESDPSLERTVLVSRSPATLLAGGARKISLGASVAPALGPLAEQGSKDVAFFSESQLAPPGTADFNEVDDVYGVRIPLPDPAHFALPPSNHLRLAFQGIVKQRNLDGTPTGGAIKTERFGGLDLDAKNTLWVLDAGRVSQYAAADFQPIDTLELDPGGELLHGIAAFAGAVYVGIDSMVYRFTSFTDPVESFSFDAPPLSVKIAGDPFGHAWVGAQYDDRFELVRFAGDLVPSQTIQLPFPDGEPGQPYYELAVDSEGDLRLRSIVELAKVTHGGHVAWRKFLPPGDGLAIDAFGNSYFVSGQGVGSLDSDGVLRFMVDVDFPLDQAGRHNHLAIDGNGDLWVLPEQNTSALKISLPSTDEETIGERISIIGLEAPLAEQKSDVTGFSEANVTGRSVDSDGDAYPNGREVARLHNPFNATPPEEGRFPPVIDLTARVVDGVGGPAVLLEWGTVIDFCEYEVTRNGRPLPGSPFEGEPLRVGFNRFELADKNPIGGLNRYRLIGVGECLGMNKAAPARRLGAPLGRIFGDGAGVPDGGGAGEPDGGGAGEPDGGGAGPPSLPKSDPYDASATLGEGAIVDLNRDIEDFFDVDGTAVTVDDTKVFVAVQDALVEFDIDTADTQLKMVDEIPLPAVPFESTTITGLAVDPDDDDMVFVLLSDGRFYHQEKGDTTSPAVPIFDLPAVPGNVPAGFDSYEYNGLVIRDGVCMSVQSSILLSVSEPTIECLIGFRPSGPAAGEVIGQVIFGQALDGEDGVYPCRDTRWSGGVALLDPEGAGSTLLFGTGASGPTIDEISTLSVSEGAEGVLSLTPGDTALSLDVGLLGEVYDFGYSASENLLVVAAEHGYVALINANFPPAQQMSATPGAVKWDVPVDVELEVSYGHTGKSFADLSFGVFIDGDEVTPDNAVVNGADTAVVLTLALNDDSKQTRRISVQVRSTEGSSTCEIPFGFLRGDSNNDGAIDVSDAVHLLRFLFSGGSVPACLDAANVDDSFDEGVNEQDVADVLLLLNYLFRMGDPPPAPFGEFGIDKTVDQTIQCTE